MLRGYPRDSTSTPPLLWQQLPQISDAVPEPDVTGTSCESDVEELAPSG